MLRHAVRRSILGARIGHPNVIHRRHAIDLIEAAEGEDDLRGASLACVRERRAADAAEAALDSGRRTVAARRVPIKLDRC